MTCEEIKQRIYDFIEATDIIQLQYLTLTSLNNIAGSGFSPNFEKVVGELVKEKILHKHALIWEEDGEEIEIPDSDLDSIEKNNTFVHPIHGTIEPSSKLLFFYSAKDSAHDHP